MNSLCSDLQGKALQSCCVFCLCSQPRQNVSVYNRGITVALWRIILINWRRSSPGVCGEWLFDPFTYGDQPIDWREFVSKTPRYRLAADYKCTEPWIFPRFPVLQPLVPFASDHLRDLTESLFVGSQYSSLQNYIILNIFVSFQVKLDQKGTFTI